MDAPIGRREVLRAGSVLGVLSLFGCAGGGDSPAKSKPLTAGSALPKTDSSKAFPEMVDPVPVPVIEGVLPRTRWTSAGLVHPENARLMNGVTCVTVHHDKIPVALYGESESDTITRMKSIQAAHTSSKTATGAKWADIGYHLIVDRAGRVWEGRPLKYQGSHVQDHNEHNVGVLCLGNFERQTPSKPMTDRLDSLLLQLAVAYGLKLDAIKTHRDWNPTTENPGRSMQTYMDRTRAEGGALRRMMAGRGLV